MPELDGDAEVLRLPVELCVPDNDADAEPLGVVVDDGDPVGEPDELGEVLCDELEEELGEIERL